MTLYQHTLHLPAYPRGFHLITRIIERELTDIQQIRTGLLQVFIQHTSASLTINRSVGP